MIKITDVSFGYTRKRKLFNSLSLELPQGSIVGLLGRNGEGKSTLMKLIVGQLIPSVGQVETLGHTASQRKVGMLQQVYMLPEDLQLPRMSVRTYFDLIAPFYPTYDEQFAQELIRAFEIDWSMNLGKMSLGQKKKAAISLALSVRTPLLLLDEPTNGLDIPSKSVFRRMLAQYIGEEQTVIISTHQVRDLEQLIDRILLMDNNRIACNESIMRLMEVFHFGTIDGTNSSRVIYREPSIMGELGVWPVSEGEDMSEEFSMELFFNAMVSQRATMDQVLRSKQQSQL